MNRSLCAALLASVVCSCGKADRLDQASRIAARVNGDEITMHQVIGVVENSNDRPVSSQQTRRIAAQILERLIDQTLLVQRALADRLDRDPGVQKAIEEERRRILAQAYLERSVVVNYQPTSAEIHRFYADNPALFSARRLYRINEVTAAVPAEQIGMMKSQTARAHSLRDIAAWLRSHDLPFQAATSIRPAEQIPSDMLIRIAEMKPGDVAVFAASDHVSAVELVQIEDAALSEAQAGPVIERYLSSRKRIELAQAEVKRLRDAARIEYLGEFEKHDNAPDLFKPVIDDMPQLPGLVPVHAKTLSRCLL